MQSTSSSDLRAPVICCGIESNASLADAFRSVDSFISSLDLTIYLFDAPQEGDGGAKRGPQLAISFDADHFFPPQQTILCQQSNSKNVTCLLSC
jgi:hypothetical protein